VHERVSPAGGEESGDVRRSDLHLEGGGDAVLGLQPVVLAVLGMLMQIDEAGRHHEAPRVDDARSDERSLGNPGDPLAPYAHLEHGIPTGLRVHHPAATDHQIEPLRRRG
jgi:hypothetical protein